MEFQYRVEVFTLGMPQGPGEEQPKVVYACDVDGECTVRDLRAEHREELSELLNEMGRDGWELIQIIPQSAGLVMFWKRVAEPVPKGGD